MMYNKLILFIHHVHEQVLSHTE